MLKQDVSILASLLLISTTHTGLYTVASIRGVASQRETGGVASSSWAVVRREREIELPTRRNLTGVPFSV